MAPSEVLEATARSFMAAVQSLDADKMVAVRASNCTHLVLPKSLGRSAMSNEEFRSAYGPMLRYFTAPMELTINSIISDTMRNKVVLLISTSSETVGGAWGTEYVYFLGMDETGKSVEVVEEFIDTENAKSQRTRLMEGIAKLEQAKAT